MAQEQCDAYRSAAIAALEKAQDSVSRELGLLSDPFDLRFTGLTLEMSYLGGAADALRVVLEPGARMITVRGRVVELVTGDIAAKRVSRVYPVIEGQPDGSSVGGIIDPEMPAEGWVS